MVIYLLIMCTTQPVFGLLMFCVVIFWCFVISWYSFFMVKKQKETHAMDIRSRIRNKLAVGDTVVEVTRINAVVKQYIAEVVEANKVDLIKAMLRQAKKGNVFAFNSLMDRCMGKPAQELEVSGKDGAPIVFMPLQLIQKHALEVANEDIQEAEMVEEKN